MMKELVLVICIAGILQALNAFEVPVAEFQTLSDSEQINSVDSRDFNQSLFSALTVKDQQGLIGFKFIDSSSTSGIIKSQIDAVKDCEIHGWEIVVYGQIVSKEFGYDVEIKIYNHPDRKIIRAFLLRSSKDDYDTLIEDCANKIFTYFSEFLRVDLVKKPIIAEANAIITTHSLEWWGMVPPWLDIMTSIAGYHGTVGFRLGSPLWTNGEWSILQEFGTGIGFHFAMSKVGVISSYLYDIDFGLSATWVFSWEHQQELRVGIEPGVKIHILNYIPLYESTTTDVWSVYGAQLNLEYLFWLDAQRSFGIGLESSIASYFVNPFYLDYRVGINLAWKGKVQ